jgi:hypothetical protein
MLRNLLDVSTEIFHRLVDPQTLILENLGLTEKRAQYHSPQTFVEFEFPARMRHSNSSGSRWKMIV